VGCFGGAGGDGGLRAAGVVGRHFAGETLGGGGVDVVEADCVCWGELGLEVASHLVALMMGVRDDIEGGETTGRTIWPRPMKA
jgi:hypothetical protein